MQENCIAVALELPGLDILWQREFKGHFEVTVIYQRDRETDRSRAEEMLRILEEKIACDSLPEFKKLLYTLTNWREEILNYFDYPITNGFVEGKE